MTRDSNSASALVMLKVLMLVGILAIVLFSLQSSSLSEVSTVVGIGVALAGSALLMGGLLGFLFGIPRTLQQKPDDASSSAELSSEEKISYDPNTNLEQISDWLTKILVGVGLTQLSNAPGALRQLSEAVAPGLGNSVGSSVFAPSIVVLFAASGFLYAYLWTRLFLAGALRKADIALWDERLQQVVTSVEEIRSQGEKDVSALNLAQKQLESNPAEPPINQEELNSAIAAGSRAVRATIFYQAQRLRSEKWKDEKEEMEKTIPIFRALIAADPGYHRDHGQLGYALKDKRQPDWKGASESLSEAIRLRGSWREHGYVFYELNRATCEVQLDQLREQSQTSTIADAQGGVTARVIADLQAVYAWGLGDLVENDEQLLAWLRRKEISQEVLLSKKYQPQTDANEP